jgi:methionine sulfoxide reductase heme-binding subunit
MNKHTEYSLIPQQWQIVSISTLILVLLMGSIAIVHGIDEASWRIAIRSTARTSAILFVIAFIASAIRKFYPGKIGNWLLKNRRYLGISFAISHAFHALTIVGLAMVAANSVRNDAGAMLGYVFIILMTITSFDRPAQLLGYRSWKILHGTGAYYLWIAFVVAFSKRIPDNPGFYAPITVALVMALLLKIGAYWYRPKSIDLSDN